MYITSKIQHFLTYFLGSDRSIVFFVLGGRGGSIPERSLTESRSADVCAMAIVMPRTLELDAARSMHSMELGQSKL